MTVGNTQLPVEIRPSSLDELRSCLAERPGSLYAILDACEEPRVPDMASQLGDRAVSLYRGAAERDYWAIAPYLAVVDEPLLDWIVENLWEDPWGIFAITETGLASLRTHFRRFLKVQDPDGKELYFRFYDPRVLPTFLTTCNASEAEQFFGPVRSFCVQGEESHLVRMQQVGGH